MWKRNWGYPLLRAYPHQPVRDLVSGAGDEKRRRRGAHLGAQVGVGEDVCKLSEENAGQEVCLFDDDCSAGGGELVGVHALVIIGGR